jgi:hypothetical protein
MAEKIVRWFAMTDDNKKVERIFRAVYQDRLIQSEHVWNPIQRVWVGSHSISQWDFVGHPYIDEVSEEFAHAYLPDEAKL